MTTLRVALRRECCTIASSLDGPALGAHREVAVVGTEGDTAVIGMTDIDPLHLVVVDDDEDVRTALRRLLRSMGHEVRVFASAEEYEACRAVADCLIVDLRLPGLNGFELRERLRLRGSAIPIVFITGDGGPSPADTTAHADTTSLAKPFDDGDLMAAIRRAVSAIRESAH
jgi:FixJ family two-component response regulator